MYYTNVYLTSTYTIRSAKDIAMICLPWRMYLLRYLLWGVYSYLHYISAFFLVLTLLVYLIFPALRDNIQGYSMICFLICMIVVQLEYGILLSLPLEPHTWCFFRSNHQTIGSTISRSNLNSTLCISSASQQLFPVCILYLDYCDGIQHLAPIKVIEIIC